MSFISSLFTAPGTNARQGQADSMLGQSQKLASAYSPGWDTLGQQFKYGQTLVPQQQSVFQNLQKFYDPKMYMGMADTLGNQARNSGMNQANYAAGMFGQNSGLAKGAFTSALNQGNEAHNSYLANAFSPQNQSQMGQGLMSLISNMMNPTMLQPMLSAYGAYQNQSPYPVSQNPLTAALVAAAPSLMGGMSSKSPTSTQGWTPGTSTPYPGMSLGVAGWGGPSGSMQQASWNPNIGQPVNWG